MENENMIKLNKHIKIFNDNFKSYQKNTKNIIEAIDDKKFSELEKLLVIHNNNLREYENALNYDESGYKILEHAILTRNIDALVILYKYIDPDYTDEDGHTVLMKIMISDFKFAAEDVQIHNGEMLTYLFDNTKTINNKEYCYLLDNVVENYIINENCGYDYEFENICVIKKLIAYGANPYIWKEDETTKSPFNFSVKCGCADLVKLFLENIDLLFYEHEYEYLSSAIYHYDVLELILPHVKNINAVKNEKTILQYVRQNTHIDNIPEIIELLITYGAI